MAIRAAAQARRIFGNPWARTGVVAAVAMVSLWNIERVPSAAPLPLLLGVLPWAIGKYLLSPLRWQAISESGRTLWWHLRVYAEAELLGLMTPMHAGADVWRLHRLHEIGMRRPRGVAELALDRLLGGLGISLAVLLTGVTLPLAVIVGLAAVGAGALVVAVAVRVRRPDLFRQRPLPGPGILVASVLLSLGFQATILARLAAVTTALGHPVDPIRLAAVFGATQVAGILPGVNGASPQDGALAVGLVSLGLPWGSALAAVALLATLAWPPAVLLGGTSFVARRLAI
ncbi:MAG TPA: lysylphosphatidylglycerol synthase domain-containing protein, partial [Rugosimonospora sp.]|nr:lysylphosphatidylglycerol synthase domain-containing protein [Rugosimonospora sp.]